MCPSSRVLPLLSLLTMLSSHILQTCNGDDSYENISALMNRLLGPTSGYNPNLRPRNYQNDTMVVKIVFSIVSLEEIDDVKQSFATNGFLIMEWKDEKISWNKEDYGGIPYFVPNFNDIWRPQLVLMNTLGERDVFKEEKTPLSVLSSGNIIWMAGGIIKASCGLDMTKYPFDEQSCSMLFCPSCDAAGFLTFEAMDAKFDFTFYVSNEAWDITGSQIKPSRYPSIINKEVVFSCFELIIKVKRRSSYFILNLICPVLMLSFLNNFVFLMPDESGEKIGYGITVLLSLSVFLSTDGTVHQRAQCKPNNNQDKLFRPRQENGTVDEPMKNPTNLGQSDQCSNQIIDFQQKVSNGGPSFKQNNKLFRPRQANGTDEPMKNSTNLDQADQFSNQVIDFRQNVSNDCPSMQAHIYRITTRHINKICFFFSMSCWVVTQITYILYVIT